MEPNEREMPETAESIREGLERDMRCDPDSFFDALNGDFLAVGSRPTVENEQAEEARIVLWRMYRMLLDNRPLSDFETILARHTRNIISASIERKVEKLSERL